MKRWIKEGNINNRHEPDDRLSFDIFHYMCCTITNDKLLNLGFPKRKKKEYHSYKLCFSIKLVTQILYNFLSFIHSIIEAFLSTHSVCNAIATIECWVKWKETRKPFASILIQYWIRNQMRSSAGDEYLVVLISNWLITSTLQMMMLPFVTTIPIPDSWCLTPDTIDTSANSLQSLNISGSSKGKGAIAIHRFRWMAKFHG